MLEPWLAFNDPDFALFTVLRRQPWPERAGISDRNVRKLSITETDRNNYMWSKLEHDRNYQRLVRATWAEDFAAPTAEEAGELRRSIDVQVKHAAATVRKLGERNIPIIFVRDPSAGPYLAYEERDFPP